MEGIGTCMTWGSVVPQAVYLRKHEWGRSGLNRRPTDYESAAIGLSQSAVRGVSEDHHPFGCDGGIWPSECLVNVSDVPILTVGAPGRLESTLNPR